MTNLEIQAELAKVFGWSFYMEEQRVQAIKPDGKPADPNAISLSWNTALWHVPHFHNDLNILNPAISKLPLEKLLRFLHQLKSIVARDYHFDITHECQGWTELATADQRAEAVLRAHDQWKERSMSDVPI